MKYIFIVLLSLLTLSNAANIELTGDYSKTELGNPFRAILEKKGHSIKIYSEDKELRFNVETNLDKNGFTNTNIPTHPDYYTFYNKSVENVAKNYYAEEYNVVQDKGGVEVNVVSGKIKFYYFDQEVHHSEIIQQIELTLEIEVIKDGLRTLQTITLDDSLGIKGKNYSWSLTLDDIKGIRLNSINTVVENIAEVIIFRVLKDRT